MDEPGLLTGQPATCRLLAHTHEFPNVPFLHLKCFSCSIFVREQYNQEENQLCPLTRMCTCKTKKSSTAPAEWPLAVTAERF